MNEPSHWPDLFEGFSHLVVEPNVDGSETYVSLPWRLWRHRGRDRSKALEERRELLERLFSVWKKAYFFYGDAGVSECRELSLKDLETIYFHENQIFGDWMIVFGSIDYNALNQDLQAERLALLTRKEMFERIGAPCTVFSSADDDEWTIYLSKNTRINE